MVMPGCLPGERWIGSPRGNGPTASGTASSDIGTEQGIKNAFVLTVGFGCNARGEGTAGRLRARLFIPEPRGSCKAFVGRGVIQSSLNASREDTPGSRGGGMDPGANPMGVAQIYAQWSRAEPSRSGRAGPHELPPAWGFSLASCLFILPPSVATE